MADDTWVPKGTCFKVGEEAKEHDALLSARKIAIQYLRDQIEKSVDNLAEFSCRLQVCTVLLSLSKEY